MVVSRCVCALPGLLALMAVFVGAYPDQCGQDFKGVQGNYYVTLPPVEMPPGIRDWLVTVPDQECGYDDVVGLLVQPCDADSPPEAYVSDDLKHASVHRTSNLDQAGTIYVTAYCAESVNPQGGAPWDIQVPFRPFVPGVVPVVPRVRPIVPGVRLVADPVYN